MPPVSADRRLRRLVAKMAGASAEDVGTILDELEPAQRAVVTNLLAEYLAGESGSAPLPARPELPLISGLSPWLSARLASADRSSSAGSEAERFTMTPGAAAGLREAAAILSARASKRPAPDEASAGWLTSFTRRLQARP